MRLSAAKPSRQVATYAITIGVTGALVAAVAPILFGGPRADTTTVALFTAVVFSVLVPLRFQRRSGTQGFTLDEAVLVAMLFALPSGAPPVVHLAGIVTGHAILRTGPLKVVFNAGQLALASSAATLVFHMIGTSENILAPRSLLATVAATITLNTVNSAALAELFRRLEARPYRTTLRDVWRLNLVTWAGNTSFGLLLAFVVLEDPLAAVLASTLMVGLYLGYRGYAGMLEERQRNDRLNEVTRMLVDAPATPDAFQRFLHGLARLLGGGTAELVLRQGSDHCAYSVGPDGFEVRRSSGALTGPAAEGIRRRTALYVTRDDPSGPQPPGDHRDALVAPLVYEDDVLGAVLVCDRYGLEPWEQTDAQLLGSIAHEAAIALKNVELFDAIERERARLAEESRKLGDIVDAASDGIVLVTGDGRVAAWNPAMAAITGLDAAEAIGQRWFVALRLRQPDGVDIPVDGDSPLHRALRGRRHDGPLDVQILRRDGRWRWLRCTLAPLRQRDGGSSGTVIVARDTTREREVEQLKADFVATVSHELRTPLTPLKGFVETLRDSGDALTPQQVDGVYTSMGRQVGRLENLVSDLLLVVDLDRDGLHLRPEAVDLAAVTRAVAAREDPAGRVVIAGSGPAMAVGDVTAVTRILRALLSNALKHASGTVTVSFGAEGGRASVHVADEGPGIPSWELERIFERFTRLGDHLRRTQGPGLGLPIARALARELGGDVTLTSEVGFGSVFTLDLPAAAAAPRPTGAGDASAPPPPGSQSGGAAQRGGIDGLRLV